MVARASARTLVSVLVAALALVLLGGEPARAATVSISVGVPEGYSVELLEYPAVLEGAQDLDAAEYGGSTWNAETHTETFNGLKPGQKLLLRFRLYDLWGSSSEAQYYYFGDRGGFSYPLVKPLVVPSNNLALGAIKVPARGAVEVELPLAEARESADVYLERLNGTSEYLHNSPIFTNPTASIRDVVPGQYLLYYSGNGRYLPSQIAKVTISSGKTTRVVFNDPVPAASVSGTVTDRAGKPLKGVGVTLDGWTTDVTSANGKFRFEGLKPGAHTVKFETQKAKFGSTGKSAQYRDRLVKVTARGGEDAAVAAALELGGKVKGTVKYAGKSASVLLVNSKGLVVRIQHLKKNAKKFEFKGLAAGKYSVYVVDKKSKAKYGMVKIKVAAGKTAKTKKIVANRATLTLKGKVLGKKPSGAHVDVNLRYQRTQSSDYVGLGSNTLYRGTRASSSGQYVVKNLVPGLYEVYVTRRGDYGGKTTNTTVKKSKTKNVNLAPPVPKPIAVKKLTYGGRPIAWVRLGPQLNWTGYNGVVKVSWSEIKGGKPVLFADDIFGPGTPYYFTLNKTKISTKEDLATLAVTGIGGG